MDIKIIFTAIIGMSLSISTAQPIYPFQPGPLVFDPYGSFLASSELEPFAVRQYPTKHLQDFNYQKIPSFHQRNQFHRKPIMKSHRSEKSQFLEELPMRKINSKNNIPVKVQPKRKYHKMNFQEHKHNGYNYKTPTIRPKPNEYMHRNKEFPPKTYSNNDRLDSEHRNSDRNQRFSRKPLIDQHRHYHQKSNSFVPHIHHKRIPTHEIDLSGEMSIGSDDEPQHKSRSNKNKVQYMSPPNEFKSYSTKYPSNYRSQRPAIYEMEPPKDLHTLSRPKVVQDVRVPHQSLLQLADISGHKFNRHRPKPFNDFYHKSKHTTQLDYRPQKIISSNSNDGVITRQVGASVSFGPNKRNINVIGKVFDEGVTSGPHSRSEPNGNYKKYLNSKAFDSDTFSFSTKPIKSDQFNSFNSKPNHPSQQNQRPHNQIQQPYNSDTDQMYSKPMIMDKDKRLEPKVYSQPNDESYETDYEDHEVFSQEKPYQESIETTQKPMQLFFNVEPSSTPVMERSESEQSSDEESDEWTSSGIPGEPGKDYPLLSSVPLRTEFSCAGKPYGFYADISQKCQVYHQCSSQGPQKFLCPNGTLFNQESLVCEWWYNVYCENSDKLYHKNANLYVNNQSNKQNQEKHENHENKKNIEENNIWNFDSNQNNNINNNDRYNNFMNNDNQHRNDRRNNQLYSPPKGDNQRDDTNYRNGSNLKERYSVPDTHEDDDEEDHHQEEEDKDEIDIDLTEVSETKSNSVKSNPFNRYKVNSIDEIIAQQSMT